MIGSLHVAGCGKAMENRDILLCVMRQNESKTWLWFREPAGFMASGPFIF
jgi:hypothetical protein